MNKSHQLEPIRLQVPLYMGVIKEITKLVPRVLLRYISTWEFLRTLEKCEKHLASARASIWSIIVINQLNRSPLYAQAVQEICPHLSLCPQPLHSPAQCFHVSSASSSCLTGESAFRCL